MSSPKTPRASLLGFPWKPANVYLPGSTMHPWRCIHNGTKVTARIPRTCRSGCPPICIADNLSKWRLRSTSDCSSSVALRESSLFLEDESQSKLYDPWARTARTAMSCAAQVDALRVYWRGLRALDKRILSVYTPYSKFSLQNKLRSGRGRYGWN